MMSITSLRALVLLLTVASGVGACSPPMPPTSTIDRVQPGDTNLTCSQIRDQVAQLDATQSAANAQVKTSTSSLGDQNRNAAAFAMIPVVGPLISLSKSTEKNQTASASMQGQQDAADAKARKENLIAIGNGKGCY